MEWRMTYEKQVNIVKIVLTLVTIAITTTLGVHAGSVKANKLENRVENMVVTFGDKEKGIEYTVFKDCTTVISNKSTGVKYEIRLDKESLSMIQDLLSRDAFKKICNDTVENNYYISYKENAKIYYSTEENIKDNKEFNRNYSVLINLVEKATVVKA